MVNLIVDVGIISIHQLSKIENTPVKMRLTLKLAIVLRKVNIYLIAN